MLDGIAGPLTGMPKGWVERQLDSGRALLLIDGVDRLGGEHFTAMHLDRMSPPDLAAFVRQRHQAVRELGDDLPCPVDDLPLYEPC